MSIFKFFSRKKERDDEKIKLLQSQLDDALAQLEKALIDLERVKIFAQNILESYEELVDHVQTQYLSDIVKKDDKNLN